MNEYEYEPVRGLPEQLPAGEYIVWQGEPQWRLMAQRVFHTRALSIYFSLLIVLHSGSQLMAGAALDSMLLNIGWQLGLAATTLGILTLMAYLYARSTVYTLTNHRLVIRFGVAVPMMINIPLDTVESAALRDLGNDYGDLVLTPLPGVKMSYWALWPNARPWHYSRVKPMLRCIPAAQSVANSLASLVAPGGADRSRNEGNKQKAEPDHNLLQPQRAPVLS